MTHQDMELVRHRLDTLKTHGMSLAELAIILGVRESTVGAWRLPGRTIRPSLNLQLKLVADLADAVILHLGHHHRRGHVSLFFATVQTDLNHQTPGAYLKQLGRSRHVLLEATRRFAYDVMAGQIALRETKTRPSVYKPRGEEMTFLKTYRTIKALEPYFSLCEIGEFVGEIVDPPWRKLNYNRNRGRWVIDLLAKQVLASSQQQYQLTQALLVARILNRYYGPMQVREIMRYKSQLYTCRNKSILQLIAEQRSDKESRKWTDLSLVLITRKFVRHARVVREPAEASA